MLVNSKLYAHLVVDCIDRNFPFKRSRALSLSLSHAYIHIRHIAD